MAVINKAKIKILDSSSKLKSAAAIIDGDAIPCIFNPTDFTIQRSVNYNKSNIPGLDYPVQHFISGEAETMSFSLMFDTYSTSGDLVPSAVASSAAAADGEKKDVRDYTDLIMGLTEVNSDTHKPSSVKFVWGPISFEGHVESVSQRFTLFNASGVPVRATVDITLVSEKTDSSVRNSPDRTKARTVFEGDRLYSFAYAEYGDCSEWRRIAEANGIDNPRLPESGTDIVIPPIL